MNTSRSYRWCRRSVWLAAVLVASIGCTPASLSYFLFKGDGKAPAVHPLEPKDGKSEVAIAILCSATNPPTEFAGIDRELTVALGRALHEQTKDRKSVKAVFKSVDAGKIDRFKAANPGWRTMPASELGKQLGADYVIDATIGGLGLYEPGTGTLMFQGRASVDVKVVDVATGIQHSEYFVNTTLDSKPADGVSMSQYKALLVQRIAKEMSWQHVPHVSDQRVPGEHP